MIEPTLAQTLKEFARGREPLTVLTGAGVSAESGIPTFRGPEGYWTVGSKVYQPQEMATYEMFLQEPEAVWTWYLYRMTVCRKAAPNPGHLALAAMEEKFGERFTLITQNVDGLHLQAGNSLERTYQIHGNIFFMRCAQGCTKDIFPMPGGLADKQKGDQMSAAEAALLKCPRCGGWGRPHVLWFDETYNEAYYRFNSSLDAAAKTGLLLIVGTSGATNLPNQVVWEVKRRNGIIIDVNIDPNPFTRAALSSQKGFFVQAPGGEALPAIMEIFSIMR